MKRFRRLHEKEEPLLLANVWDAASARAAEAAGYQALGTSSGAMAGMLGYKDGEEMTFDELLYMVQRIGAVTDLPLSVDMEGGYGRTAEEITGNLTMLIDAGVEGVNLEDSLVTDGKRVLQSADDFAQLIQEVAAGVKDTGLFLNIRTDAFLLGVPDATEETIRRAELYAEAGGNGIFVPGIVMEEDIRVVAQNTTLPLNVMCVPGLPDLPSLKALGVKRISMGNFAFENMYKELQHTLMQIRETGSFSQIV